MSPKCLTMLLLLIGCISVQSAAGQEVLYWKADRPLTWDDFKGQPTTNNWRHAAFIKYHLSRTANDNGHGIARPDIKSLCCPHKSWKRVTEVSPALLQHEQTHFDITELYARKARKAITRCDRWYHSDGRFRHGRLNSIYRRYWWGCSAVQMWYDFRTRHSIHERRQQAWNHKTAERLRTYQQYGQQ